MGNLETVNAPNVSFIGQSCFLGSGFKEISLPGITMAINSYGCFYNCRSLISVSLPNAKQIGGTTYTVGRLFNGCSKLKTVNIPQATIIGYEAFFGTYALTHIDMPMVEEIIGGAFQDSGLITVNMPNIKTIGSMAFRNTNIETLDLYNCESIGNNAFNSTNMTTLILRNESDICTTDLHPLAFTPIEDGTGYIYVPSALIDSYKTATNWSEYANQFRAIEDYPEITGG